jgi:2,4-dienoyl-CoA reductase-like NADH-dependent reductase (Old Yellow Enzyme family)
MNKQKIYAHPAFSGFILKGRLFQNRFVVSPMSRVSATTDGLPTPLMKEYYVAFAAGDFSMIITEGLYTDNLFSQAYTNQPGIVNDAQAARWKGIVSAVHENNSLIIAQLMHAGGISQHLAHTAAPTGDRPSGKKMPEYGGGDGEFPVPRQLSEEDIEAVIEGYVHSASLAVQAGFDGVELHGANGYLLDQFLTAGINNRTDRWGGSMENRTRIIKEITRRIRKVVPGNFIIGLRLSEGKVNDLRYRWPDGAATAHELLRQLSAAPPDYIHIAAETGRWERDCVYPDGSSYSGIAKSVMSIPVIANGGLHRLALSKSVLDEGHADLIALGTADPSWPLKVRCGIEPVPFIPAFIKPSATIEHAIRIKKLS